MTEGSIGSNIWNDRDLGISNSTTQGFGLISDADIEYCCNCLYSFVQLVNANAVFGEELPLNFITTSTGWLIHDYGDAISVSYTHQAEQKKSAQSSFEQAKTAEEIMDLIIKKGWTAVEVIAGTQTMKRFIWVEAKRAKLGFAGYTPNASDEKCYDRLAKRAKDMGFVWEHPIETKQKEGAATAT